MALLENDAKVVKESENELDLKVPMLKNFA
jgi:hypothetical protein